MQLLFTGMDINASKYFMTLLVPVGRRYVMQGLSEKVGKCLNVIEASSKNVKIGSCIKTKIPTYSTVY